MQFRLNHHIAAPVEAAERAANAPEFQARLASLPNIAERRVTELDERPDGSIHRIVRYRFSGPLPSPVVRALGGSPITWDEEGIFDPTRHQWDFEIHPLVFKGRIKCTGRYAFEPDGNATSRVVELDLRVSIPIVGRLVERVIADGLTEAMYAEASELAEFLREAAGDPS